MPDVDTLKIWSRTCLCIEDYEDGSPTGGWSPSRSHLVHVCEAVGARLNCEKYFYKCSDESCWDIITKHAHGGTSTGADPWLLVWERFLKVSFFYALKFKLGTDVVDELFEREIAIMDVRLKKIVGKHLRSKPFYDLGDDDYALRRFSQQMLYNVKHARARMLDDRLFLAEPERIVSLVRRARKA